MTPIKGHFDGTSVVLDEPATLAVGQAVRVVLDDTIGPARSTGDVLRATSPRPSRFGFARGTFEMRDDFNDPLDEFEEYR